MTTNPYFRSTVAAVAKFDQFKKTLPKMSNEELFRKHWEFHDATRNGTGEPDFTVLASIQTEALIFQRGLNDDYRIWEANMQDQP